MSAIRGFVACTLAAALGGCGLYVPEIQENPLDQNEGQKFVQEIALNVRCEVQDAVVFLYAKNSEVDPFNRNLSWLDSWGVQLALTLTIDEKGSLNPNGSWLPIGPPSTPASMFNLNLGGTLSSDGSRVDKINSFFLVADLKKLKPCPPDARNHGMFILESDLKLKEWLFDMMVTSGVGNTPVPANANGPFKSNVLSHEVKFDIVSSGFVTPGWKLKQGTFNQSGNFLTASRDRTQDLIVTFGPVQSTKTKDPKTGKTKMEFILSPAALNAQLAAEIGNEVSNAIRNATQP